MQLDLLEIENLCEALSKGQTVLIPTDTIWGVSSDATNKSAVERITEIKQRSADQKFILLVSSLKMLKEYADEIHPRIETLLSFHKKPTTCIYKASVKAPRHLISEDGTIAIRLVNHPALSVLIDKLGKAIVSTSANINGSPFPTSYNEIDASFKDQIDYIPYVNAENKNDLMSEPSVIIRFEEDGELVFLRT